MTELSQLETTRHLISGWVKQSATTMLQRHWLETGAIPAENIKQFYPFNLICVPEHVRTSEQVIALSYWGEVMIDQAFICVYKRKMGYTRKSTRIIDNEEAIDQYVQDFEDFHSELPVFSINQEFRMVYPSNRWYKPSYIPQLF